MENAAEQIVELADKFKDWNISVIYEVMSCKEGFLQLIYYGWLTPYHLSKKEFGVSQAFIDRVTKKLGKQLAGIKPLMSIDSFGLSPLPPIGTERL